VDATRRAIDEVFTFARDRLSERLVGLDDDEYLWEPVDNCASVRRDEHGVWRLDDAPPTSPSTVTTIAWRVCHLGGSVLSGFTAWLRDGSSPYVVAYDPPSGAKEATTFLANASAAWSDSWMALTDERTWAPIGEQFGPFADSSAVDLALHVLDEFVHHAAEIALLRDLYAQRAP
jgi:hypothetical protein